MAKKKRLPVRRSQRTMFDAAKSSAVRAQKVALRAATEAATAAAEAAVRAVMRSLSRENAVRGRRSASKRKKRSSVKARKKRH
jgi:hypothetical protein